MPLPQPVYPPYRPKEFLTPNEEGTIRRAVELYAKYHPAAMQQKLYDTLLKDEGFKAANEQKRVDMLTQERDTILSNLARFRETGLGASGRAGGRSGAGAKYGTRAGSAGNSATFDYSAAMARTEATRNAAAAKTTVENVNAINRKYELDQVHASFVTNVTGLIDDSVTADGFSKTLKGQIDAATSQLAAAATSGIEARRAAAVSIYTQVLSKHPQWFLKNGVVQPVGLQIAMMLDGALQTGGNTGQGVPFLVANLQAGESPSAVLFQIQQAELSAVGGVGPGHFEMDARDRLEKFDTDGDGALDETENAAYLAEVKARRSASGIPEPMTIEEQAFLGTYIDALRDDGVATREEIGADYDQALAAYQKGKLVERLPRGAAAFYDEAYLRGLGRLQEVDKQLGEIESRESPSTRAAQRALGLPSVPQEALEAAARISPLAAETLPFAMRRVSQAHGEVTPSDGVERFAQRLIETDNTRDFNAIARLVAKKYPNDAVARRKALSYYGAYYYVQDTKVQTTDQSMIDADSATAAAEFMREVAPTPTDFKLSPEQGMPAPLTSGSVGAQWMLDQQPPAVSAPPAPNTFLDPGDPLGRMPPAAPPVVLRDGNGNPILDQNGAPILAPGIPNIGPPRVAP